MCGLNFKVTIEWLAGVNHFQLVASVDDEWEGVAAWISALGRECHPVDVVGQRICAVGLDGYVLASVVLYKCHKVVVDEQGWFSAGEYHERGKWILHYCLDDLAFTHHGAAVVVGVAEVALQVAARKADEHGSRASVVAFALQRVEYFVDAFHVK